MRLVNLSALFLMSVFVGLPILASRPVAAQTGGNASFTLVNHASEPIREFFATPGGDANYGRSRLDGKAVPVGGTFAVRLPANGNCLYDMKVVLASGRVEERHGVNVCKDSQVVVSAAPAAFKTAGGHDPSVRLINRAGAPLTALYASPAGGPASTANLLGGTPLAPQATLVVHPPADAGCRFDLRAEFADKRARDKKNADLCAMTDLPVQ